MVKRENAHARSERAGDTLDVPEVKVPDKLTAKEAVNQMIKATRKLVNRHGITEV